MHVLNQTQVPVLQLPPLVLTKLVSFYISIVSVQYVLSLDKTITEIKKITPLLTDKVFCSFDITVKARPM